MRLNQIKQVMEYSLTSETHIRQSHYLESDRANDGGWLHSNGIFRLGVAIAVVYASISLTIGAAISYRAATLAPSGAVDWPTVCLAFVCYFRACLTLCVSQT